MTIETLIDFYSRSLKEYEEQNKIAEQELLNGKLDLMDAYHTGMQLETDKQIENLTRGFVVNLKKVQE